MKKDTKRKIIILLIMSIFLIIALTCIFIFFFMNRNSYLYDIKVEDNTLRVYSNKITLNNENINYSEINVKRFINFIKDNFDVEDNLLTINYDDLDDYEYLVISSLIDKSPEAEFEVNLERYKYCIYLNNEYIIYLKDSGLIRVKKVQKSIDGFNIIKILDSYEIKFSKDKNDELIEYILSLFKDYDHNEIYKNTISKNEEKYLYSIIYNQDDYLDRKDVNLLYKLQYNGINCPTPVLYLYDDNTYEYYYTFGVNDTPLVPMKGSYSVNIEELINESLNNNLNPASSYNIERVQDEEYFYIDGTSELLNMLLSETNATLGTCLVQE